MAASHNSLNIPSTSGTAVISNATSNGFTNLGYGYANTGSYLAQRDVNGNCSFNVVIETTTTIVSAGQTITMTNGTSQVQEITGSSTVAFNLPDATTLINGWTFVFNNIGSGICSVYQQNGSTLVETVLAGGYTFVTCANNSTVQGAWTFHNALATGSLSGTLGTTLLGFTAANTFIPGYTTTATAATTTTLTVGSTQQQYFTGSTTQTIVLPVTSTLVLGQSFTIVNNSSGVVTVQSSGANTIQAMATGTSLIVTVISTSLTTAAAWSAQYIFDAGGGTVTSVSGTTNQVAVASGTTTPVISLIGPYTPATYTAHGLLVGEGTSSIVAMATGSAGQIVQSGGSSANPAYSTATYPATAGTSGNLLTSDGTNWNSTAPATLPGSLVFISSVTASASANVAFTGLVSTYRAYRVVIQHILPASSSVLGVVLGTGAGPTYLVANYDTSCTVFGNSALSTFGSSAAANIALQTTSGTTIQTGYVDLLGPNNSNFYPTISWYLASATPTPDVLNGYGTYTASQQAITSINFTQSTGNITSGIFSLYGVV